MRTLGPVGGAWSPSAIPVVCDLGNHVPCPEAPLSILLGHSPHPRPLKLSCGLNPLSHPDLTPVFLPFPAAPAGEALWFPCRLPLHFTTEEEPLGSWQAPRVQLVGEWMACVKPMVTFLSVAGCSVLK